MNRSQDTEYLGGKLKPILLAAQNDLNDVSVSIGLEQLVSVKRDFWLNGMCIAFDSDTVFKPSVGSHYLSACSPSTSLSIHLNRQHGSPPIHSSLPSLCIGFPFSLFFHPTLCLYFSFFSKAFPWEKKHLPKSIPCAKSACASFSALSREGGRSWREEGGIFTKAHLIVKHFLSTGCNTLRNVEK